MADGGRFRPGSITSLAGHGLVTLIHGNGMKRRPTRVFDRGLTATLTGLSLGLLAAPAPLSGQWTHRYPKVDGYNHHVYLEGYELPMLTNGPIDPAPSPDGTRLAFSSRGWIWVMDLETRNALTVCRPNEGVYRRFFEVLQDIERAAGDVPLAFVLIPDEFQVEDDLWEEMQRRGDQALDRDLPQRKVTEWLAGRGRPALDLLPLLRTVEPLPDGRRHLYHLYDTHFNARGNELAGLQFELVR